MKSVSGSSNDSIAPIVVGAAADAKLRRIEISLSRAQDSRPAGDAGLVDGGQIIYTDRRQQHQFESSSTENPLKCSEPASASRALNTRRIPT